MPGTITIACKLPHGLVLRLHKKIEVQDPLPGGGTRAVDKWIADASKPTVTLKGYLDKYDPGLAPAARGSSYAFTHNVDKDFFDEWLKQNSDLDAVVNGLILAHSKDTVGASKERKETRSGLEPIDPKRLKGKIQTADEQKFLGIEVPA